MRRISLFAIIATALLTFSGTGQTLTKLFEVRNGSSEASTLIVFKDAPSKNAVIDAFCDQYGYQETIPDPDNPAQTISNPQTKQEFYHEQLTAYLRDIYKASKVAIATRTAATTALEEAENELPTIRSSTSPIRKKED